MLHLVLESALQETCRRIDLPNLPVHEYKELQTKLREHRRLTSSPVPGRRWAGFTEAREADQATTMGWLHAADQAIARKISARLIDALQALQNWPNRLSQMPAPR